MWKWIFWNVGNEVQTYSVVMLTEWTSDFCNNKKFFNSIIPVILSVEYLFCIQRNWDIAMEEIYFSLDYCTNLWLIFNSIMICLHADILISMFISYFIYSACLRGFVNYFSYHKVQNYLFVPVWISEPFFILWVRNTSEKWSCMSSKQKHNSQSCFTFKYIISWLLHLMQSLQNVS